MQTWESVVLMTGHLLYNISHYFILAIIAGGFKELIVFVKRNTQLFYYWFWLAYDKEEWGTDH